MSDGVWGTWALLVPADAAARAASVARVAAALEDLPARHPNLKRLTDIVVPLSETMGEAARSARRLADAKFVIADVTEARPEIMFALGVRDLIGERITIALHEGPAPTDVQRLLGNRLTPIAPGAAAAKIGAAASDLNETMRSTWRLRLGAYKIARAARPLEKGMMPEGRARANGPTRWRVKSGDGVAATELGLWWGDIRDIARSDRIHVIVNSENTYFEMGRIHDKGLSAIIRYCGASWFDTARTRSDDRIFRELLAKAPFNLPARDGHVVVTSSGNMRRRQGIRAIAHVAAVRPAGGAGAGFRLVDDVPACVRAVLSELDARPRMQKPTILFPLIGTGNAGADAGEISRKVIKAVADYISANPNGRIGAVLISAYTDLDLDCCDEVFEELEGSGLLAPSEPAQPANRAAA